ncbi:MAG: hypothetical protein MUC42_12865 [Bryobacter sp.]|nr:hypothetical protein [Bryobacter sp.]
MKNTCPMSGVSVAKLSAVEKSSVAGAGSEGSRSSRNTPTRNICRVLCTTPEIPAHEAMFVPVPPQRFTVPSGPCSGS